MELVETAFEVRDAKKLRRRGARTWEYWRLKHDRIYVLKHAAEGGEAEAAVVETPVRLNKLGSSVHTSFSSAEREEVQARYMLHMRYTRYTRHTRYTRGAPTVQTPRRTDQTNAQGARLHHGYPAVTLLSPRRSSCAKSWCATRCATRPSGCRS